MFNLRPAIKCADGTTLSVQASAMHYCTPRLTNCRHYTEVEVGFPSSKPPESWRRFCEADFDTRWQDTVYCYVPVQLVWDYIQEHGGFSLDQPIEVMLISSKEALWIKS